MFLSQPTISTHIKQLELELGVQLLVRSTKDVILSEAGLIFYPYAVQLLETEREALSQLHHREMKITGTVSISTSSVPGNYMLPQFLAYIKEIHPDIRYRISEGDSEKVIYEVMHFEAELGIGGMKSMADKCICEPLFEDEIVLITPNTERYRELNGKFPLEQLREERYVVRESGSGTKKFSENIERDLDLQDMKIAVQVESSEMVKRAVEAKVGIAFISKLAVKDAVSQGRVLSFSFPKDTSKRQLYLLYHKDRVLTAAARSTIKSLRHFCEDYKE